MLQTIAILLLYCWKFFQIQLKSSFLSATHKEYMDTDMLSILTLIILTNKIIKVSVDMAC